MKGAFTMAKKYFTIDRDKKRITIDTSITPTAEEKEAVEMYGKFGYDLFFKSQKRAAAMKKKASTLTKAQLEEAIKGNKEAEAKYAAIIKGDDPDYEKGFFAAKKWFKEKIEPTLSKEKK